LASSEENKYRLCSRDDIYDDDGDFYDEKEEKEHELTTPPSTRTSQRPQTIAKPSVFENKVEIGENQQHIVTALESLKANKQLEKLVNPWGLDFWDSKAANYYGSVEGLRRQEEGEAWSTEISRYNLDNLNAEFGIVDADYPVTERGNNRQDYPGETEGDFPGTTRGDYTTKSVTTSASPWEQLGWYSDIRWGTHSRLILVHF
jgi:hypothetical protein